MNKVSILSLLMIISVCSPYKILLLFPFPSSSHYILGEGYVRHLLKAGHEVTFVTATLIKTPQENLRQIDVSSNFQIIESMMGKAFSFVGILSKSVDFEDLGLVQAFMNSIANNTVRNNELQKLMSDPNEHFDVVIAEWMYSSLYSGLAPVFDCPLIWSSSMDVHGQILSLIDEDLNPAYSPDHLSAVHPPLSFWERIKQLKVLLYAKYLDWINYDLHSKIHSEVYGSAMAKRGRVLPTYHEAMYNGSLVLGNSHVSSGQSIRLPQNYKPIGGYHIDNHVKPLPEKFQKVMDEATNGVIFFSMGSLIKASTMPEEFKTGLLELFRGLKQTVIWKFEKTFPNTPKNVHVVNWAPQKSILAHPNCIMLISHGGLLSITEALHYGVPMIGIPIFADQNMNVLRAVAKGFAIHVPLGYDMHVRLKPAIKEMIENPRYRAKAKEFSFIHHHRLASPSQELVFWIEHVIKTRGALHLRSPALHVPFFQKLYLDLFLIVIAIGYLMMTVLNNVWKSTKDKVKKS